MLITRFTPIAAVLAAVLAAAAAAATVAPGHAERSAIIRAFGDPAAAAPCLIVRLAASDPDYADVRFRMTQACARWGSTAPTCSSAGVPGAGA